LGRVEKPACLCQLAGMGSLKSPDSEQPAQAVVGASVPLEVLTYSVKETSVVLGISVVSVYRLLQRRLLKPVTGIRRKRISKRQVHLFAQGGVK
jgi:hypothetical protein